MQLSVKITDGEGAAVAGVAVAWSTAEGAAIEPKQSETDPDGIASSTLSLPTAPTSLTATAVAEGLAPATFEISVHAGPPARLTLAADSIRFYGSGESLRLEFAAFDEFENAIQGAAVQWISSDASVVSVDGAGTLMAHGRGVTKVFAQLGTLRDSVAVYVLPLGVFTITFDDGFESVRSIAYPSLVQHGMPANVAVNPTPVDLGWDGYLTAAQLDELHGSGWSIVNHTLGHPHLPQLSPEQLEVQIRDAKAWIESHGFNGESVFIVPYHDWGDRELQVVKRYHKAARGYSVNPPWPDEYHPWPATDPYRLTGLEPEFLEGGFTTATGREATLARLRRIIDRGEFVDIFFHGIAPEQATGFRTLVEMLAAHKDRLRVYHQLFPD